MPGIWDDFDLGNFWEKSDWADQDYVEPSPSDSEIASVEAELGYKLPRAYIELMLSQNGGCPVNTCHPTTKATSWAENHVAITAIKGIGREQDWSLCGSLGSEQLMGEWGYPPIGIYFGDCPSSGHDAICLDYRECGPAGEPSVVHVDQELDYKITFVAKDFESFIRGLRCESAFDEDG